MVEPVGNARVMDFGIAMRIEGKGPSDQANLLLGTPAYLAPEYVKSQRVSPQGDIYAVGLIMLEMLMGRRVVRADSLRAMLASLPISGADSGAQAAGHFCSYRIACLRP